ncbi:MAG: 16S rRNA (guanine(966)-N(2))-methyltransferase RsmD [Alphaproteobacteria bacterium]|nr:16S rRNA (guanine(966)-N(2))-methyltransferase RsmD [Alphaproteobacteria bacterium]
MTRIVAGRFRGRRLEVPKGRDVRPTTDRMRERLFSMLMHGRYPDMDGATVADIFAGTGALGFEALSRGAHHVTFVEKARPSLDCIRANMDSLGVPEETTVLAKSATTLPDAVRPCDFIFMDPPYRQNLVLPSLTRILDGGWLTEGGVIICELASDETITFPTPLEIVDERTQGQQRVVFLKRTE